MITDMDFATLFRFGITCYANIAQYAIPIAFAFGMCGLIVNTFFSVGFGGRLSIGGDRK